MRFGWLLVLGMTSTPRGRCWLCECDCGNKTEAWSNDLTSGHKVSCGCRQIGTNLKHGMYKTPEYGAWTAMIGRCINPRHAGYHNYGGRGITICDRWRNSFADFLVDMGTRPPGRSLDRINNDGNYEPGNCRWATRIEQVRNQRGRFTRDQVVDIRSELSRGRSRRALAKAYGRHVSTIDDIANRKTWVDVDIPDCLAFDHSTKPTRCVKR